MAARALLVVLTLTTTACAVTPSGGPDRPLTAVATTSAWGSILGQLAGPKVRTLSLIANPDADPHDYEPTPADARALSVARLVVENGAGYDAWAGRVLDASPDSKRIVLNVAHLSGVDDDGNPHLWYSPTDIERLADAATDALVRINPSERNYFVSRRGHFDRQVLGRYHALIAEIRNRYGGVPIGASESIVSPLADALGLDLVTPRSFLTAISEGIDPAASDKRMVDEQIRDHRIEVYVFNRQNSTPDIAAQVVAARAAGVPVVAVTETLTPAGASFQSWQVRQLEALRAALHEATGR